MFLLTGTITFGYAILDELKSILSATIKEEFLMHLIYMKKQEIMISHLIVLHYFFLFAQHYVIG